MSQYLVSLPVDLINFPSVLKQTEVTDSEWPERVKTNCCSCKFHSLIVLSSEPLAINFPSGLKQTEVTHLK